MASDFMLMSARHHGGQVKADCTSQIADSNQHSAINNLQFSFPLWWRGSRRSYQTSAVRGAARQHVQILADEGRETDKDGARDNRVADRDFVEKRQVAKDGEVGQVEIVPGVDAEFQGV